MRPREEWERDRHDENVAGQIEDQIGDEMIECCGALGVVRRCLPVIVKRSAPNSEVQDQHDDICDPNVDRSAFDNQVLC